MTEFAQDTLKANIDNPAVPRVLHWLPGFFLLATVLIGGVLAVTSKAALTFPHEQDVMDGRWAHAYETGLDAGVPFKDPAVTLWGTVNYWLFGEAREGALVGTDGWLYTTEEFQTAPGDAAEIAGKVQYIRQVRDELKAQGAQLIVALLPAKVRVYPEHLGNHRVPGIKAGQYQAFRQGVEALGVPAPDLNVVLMATKTKGDVFVRTDTHWTPLGAKVVAEQLARTVREKLPALELPAATFQTRPSTTTTPGDLLRYLPLPKGTGPQAAQVQVSTTNEFGDGGGLLGDEPVAVTLVGTSYSAIKTWNFEGALKQALGTDVLNMADEGRGPVVPMRAYLKSQAIRDNPPKLVLWEIPERFLKAIYP